MATIKDVAKLADVGVGTVSRSLSGNGGVSAKAQQRISQAMLQLNYRPNSFARALSTQRSNIIGVWLPSLSGSFYQHILHAIELELRRHDKHLILANAEGAGSNEACLQHLDYLIRRDCDGVLMVCPEMAVSDLLSAQASYPPLVFINHSVDLLSAESFSVDHYLGGKLAAAALLEQGHQNIACITGRLSAQDAQQRQQGFVNELARQDRPINPKLVIEGSFDFEECRAAIHQLLSSGLAFDALFCGNDKVALVALSMLQSAGIKVPQQVAVLGYDNVDFAAYASPPLSTISIPIEQMASAACRRVLNMAYDLQLTIPKVESPRFIARASTP
ncbi:MULTISPECIES: LacI family DNA-binding transcriptional regulator [unclassified Agarivorans]|uniref:LacI family DNA-binding transcriptional regulator n=1 Tax=unclassified Agarivorans TaxID=2636026 RepID=UPI0026E14997|nr:MULTISPECIES: LacI family DNA-binding transcriptional regulator [unclassified Agarivorans]MDO6684556.1 LacI family DNA-binding transcriptional regulator [Agarivorans sp. 3_MG-2023]MDO6714721.1 LacI family DNA-binding transcriptional regulator [Agarivorans sp. 2_MG-2023]